MMLWPEILFSFLLSQVILVGDYFIPLENKSPGFEYWNSQPWPRGEVLVKFDSKVQQQDKVYFFQACEEWTEGSKASCREAQSHEKNFLFVKAEEGVGCWTALGYHSNPDFRVFNFNRACWNHYDLVLHEVGHVLGLLHEHQRSDRDHYIEVLEDNIIPELKHAFVKNLGHDPIHGEYDVESIMHYPAFAYTRNGKPVMQSKPGVREISKTNPLKMSAQDKLSISQIYGTK